MDKSIPILSYKTIPPPLAHSFWGLISFGIGTALLLYAPVDAFDLLPIQISRGTHDQIWVSGSLLSLFSMTLGMVGFSQMKRKPAFGYIGAAIGLIDFFVWMALPRL